MQRRGPSHLGPYAKACTSCFKAKCKCIARHDGPGCQRCHRLNKACQPSGAVHRHTIANKQNSKTQIAELAKKLDSLIEKLQSHNGPDSDSHLEYRYQAGPSAQTFDSGNVEPLLDSFSIGDKEQDNEDICADNEEGTEIVGSSPVHRTLPIAASSGQDFALDAESDILVATFKSRMLQHFPFLCLPSQCTARQLQRDRPFLFRAIVYVTSQTSQAAQRSELKCAMSEALLLEETDRTDLLLGLLTYLAWGWDHSKVMYRLMMQAVSLTSEISNQDPQGMDAHMKSIFTPSVNSNAFLSRAHFLEQQRAVLGCFVLSSAVAAYFNHVNPLHWTPQMDEALAALRSNAECSTDATFTVQVRLQLLGQKAMHIQRQQHIEQGHMQAPAGTTSVPALVSLMRIQTELQELQASLSVSETSCHLAHISVTELIINETRHAANVMVPMIISHFSTMTASSTAGNGTSKNSERSWCRWKCVNSIKTHAEALLALSATDFAGISFVQWAQLAHSIVVLNHLTTSMEDPTLNRATVCKIIDLPVLLDRVAKKLQLAAQVAGEHKHEGAFTELARRMHESSSNLKDSAVHEHGVGKDTITHSEAYSVWSGGLAYFPGIVLKNNVREQFQIASTIGVDTSLIVDSGARICAKPRLIFLWKPAYYISFARSLELENILEIKRLKELTNENTKERRKPGAEGKFCRLGWSLDGLDKCVMVAWQKRLLIHILVLGQE